MADVPNLEDVPEVLNRLQDRADELVKEEKDQLRKQQYEKSKKASEQSKTSQKSSSTFGGMKKGFLFGAGPSKPPKKDNTPRADDAVTPDNSKPVSSIPKETSEDIPFIQAQSSNSNLVLKEVQEAMVDANISNEFQEKLAQRLESHSDVRDVLSDPKWLPILSEFQQDPEAAMNKYKNNAKIKKTLLQLCNVLGDTFLHMEKNNLSEEEKLSKNLMENPHLKEALTDPLVMKICDYMKEGANDKVQRCLQRANSAQKQHIQMLIDCGLFSFSM
ncbi:uncharacterized protein [Palaemon carinicauda]|uniref:uncharacterized protein n=1 Tax=Palaemon carinicauda TaxID=392227 RepID=UPI0035B5F6FF